MDTKGDKVARSIALEEDLWTYSFISFLIRETLEGGRGERKKRTERTDGIPGSP